MVKENRVDKTKQQLKQDLHDQILLLVDACYRFDNGFDLAGKQISVILRILLHEYKQSKSLLEALSLRSSIKFLDTAGEINHRNLLPELNLLAWGTRTKPTAEVEYRIFPMCATEFELISRKIAFSHWWMEKIIKDSHKNLFSRFDLVKSVADTDGGAHVDMALPEFYCQFIESSKRAMVCTAPNGETIEMKGRPELACLRQIAHELLCTMKFHINLEPLQAYAPIKPYK